jgi:putative transposase
MLRVYPKLIEQGIHVGRKRVARLMRAAGLHGVRRRTSVRTTVRDTMRARRPDLVQRHFSAQAPHQL